MSVYLEVVDHDARFAKLTKEPLIANYIDIATEEERRNLKQLLYTRHEGDSLNVVPRCRCETLIGTDKIGMLCSNCGSMVISQLERPLESTIWLETPRKTAALINPVAWTVLSNTMTTSGFNILEWLVNTNYAPPANVPKKLSRLVDMGIPRGLNNFVKGFDEIMEDVLSVRGLIKPYGPDKDDLPQWIHQNRNKLFCDHLPMPSEMGFVIEATSSSVFLDKTITLALDAFWTIVSIEKGMRPLSEHWRQVKTVKAVSKLANYYYAFTNKMLGGKPGMIRKHIMGGSSHFSARGVISSIWEPHRYDHIRLPWSMALQLLRVHLINKLIKRRYSPAEIAALFRDSAMCYNPVFDELFNELLSESLSGALPATIGRNPTLARGSIQYLPIGQIKTDPTNNTIEISNLCLKGPNADFDGDAMNVMLMLDEYLASYMERLAPHTSALDLNEPRRISRNLALPNPLVATVSNYLYGGHN